MALVRSLPGSAPTPVSTRVMVSPVVEAIVAMWVTSVDVESAAEVTEYTDGERILDLVGSVGDLEDVVWLSVGEGRMWLALLPLIDEAGAGTLAELADHLDSIGPTPLHALLTDACLDDADDDHDDIDLGDPGDLHARLVATLRALHMRLDEQLAAFAPMLAHGAELERFLARRMPLDQLVETVTNGVAYQPEAGIREVVLVPSVLMRPWNLLLLHGESRYILHPISDESVDADSDTPPAWIVDLFKALGDAKRLRVLRRLREGGGASLGELTDYLDLAKSTTHHHLRILRAAGLVRTRITGGVGKDEQVFELRTDLFGEAVATVGEYLLGTNPFDEESTA